ncbi:hypothetical protein WA026_005539 [Henosepilachna vigintioctopunctata]|uniref:Odorant receptor n=1 Tax=Henosepilachna vigintioctopunctata TaxID=420089 RepID=A0AAW1U194_9CUCU
MQRRQCFMKYTLNIVIKSARQISEAMTTQKVDAFDTVNEILRRIYAYPALHENKFTIVLFLKFSILFMFITFPVIMGFIGQLCYCVRTGDQQNALQAQHKLIEILNVILSFVIFFINGNKTIKFIKNIRESSFEECQCVDIVMTKYRKTITIMYWFATLLCISYLVNSIHNQTFCDYERVAKDAKYVCGAGAALRFPVELNRFFKFYIDFLVVMALTMYFPPAFMIPFLAGVGLSILECRLQHLATMLQNINCSEDDVMNLKRKFNRCIKYYAKTRRLVNELNDSIGYNFIQQYSMMAVLLALFEYETMKTKSILAILRLVGYLIFEITTCTFGQRLINQNDKLYDVVNSIEWYDMPPEIRNNFKFFILLVQRPMHLLAKPLIVLNYEFLLMVI